MEAHPLTKFPKDVIPYVSRFVDFFGRYPAKHEKSFWIKTIKQWIAIGVEPDHVSRMFDYCKTQGTTIKSPASITYAYDAIRTQKSVYEGLEMI